MSCKYELEKRQSDYNNKKGHHRTLKAQSTHQDPAILSLCVAHSKVSKHTKQNLVEKKREPHKFTVVAEDFKLQLRVFANQHGPLDLPDMIKYSTQQQHSTHPVQVSPNTHWEERPYPRHITNLNQPKRILVIHSMLSNHNGIKSEISTLANRT